MAEDSPSFEEALRARDYWADWMTEDPSPCEAMEEFFGGMFRMSEGERFVERLMEASNQEMRKKIQRELKAIGGVY